MIIDTEFEADRRRFPPIYADIKTADTQILFGHQKMSEYLRIDLRDQREPTPFNIDNTQISSLHHLIAGTASISYR
jgi:hypothetical protein